MPSTEHLCMPAQALIASEWSSRLKFAVWRSFGVHGNCHCWEVIRKEDNNLHDHSPIPRFQRIRKVTLNEDHRLECDFTNFNRIGHPCRHIYTAICYACGSSSCHDQRSYYDRSTMTSVVRLTSKRDEVK
mmetsp:Transcript_23772/g.34065  ORF Transcript_23772/g.34065 Transcript_23772/m.34065 type:complete len:130 (-) Transcript_23772:175-564(-)